MATGAIRIGFVPLMDAAPVIAAHERGFFADEGLSATLHRQIGWANVRDKLSFGHLDAAQALLGMPLTSHLGRDSCFEPLVAVMGLGTGGNAITVRRELYDSGVRSAADLAAIIKQRPGMGRPVAGHVFGSSTHHFLLREWLAAGGLDPDQDTKLCVIPPPQMTEHMRGGYLDLFCVGEPWNTVAARQGVGVALVPTTDILPRHPEKVFVVPRRFADQAGGVSGGTVTALVRAVLRGFQWCAEAATTDGGAELAAMLARSEYLALPAEILRASLTIYRHHGAGHAQKNAQPARRAAENMPTEVADGTFPNKMHAVWMMREMIRWGYLHPEADVLEIAGRCSDAAAYRTAAASLGVNCPETDFVPMELRGGRKLRLEDVRATRNLAARRHAVSDLNTEAHDRSPARVA